jgi:hypothetical protein
MRNTEEAMKASRAAHSVGFAARMLAYNLIGEILFDQRSINFRE